MNMNILLTAMALQVAATTAVLGCDLKVNAAWIREAPPNAMAMAGYAKLSNVGAAPLKVQSITSSAFNSIETHESFTENGLAKMRPVIVEIPVKSSVEFAAGGKHFMLMGAKQPLHKGDVVTIKISDASGCVTAVPFKVSAAPVVADQPGIDHSTMDHGAMDHSNMKHE